MSKNKFDNFFNDPTSVIKDEKFRPTFTQKIEGVILLVSKRPDWYCNPEIRQVVVNIVADVNSDLHDMLERQKVEPECHVFGGAFMMLLNDMIRITSEFASDEERAMWEEGKLDSDEEDEG